MNLSDGNSLIFRLPDPFKAVINKTVDTFHLLEPDDSVLIAVSGGPDSVALTFILRFLKQRFKLSLGLAHFNHLLRPEDAHKDEAFVRQLAETLDLPFHCKQQDVAGFAKKEKLSVETAGRDLRYAFFDQTAMEHGYSKIATGHTKDDNAEQVLMNLIRGAGPTGLTGIPPVRNKIIRPLIDLPKNDILALLKKNNQPYRVDLSNMDTRFLRNRVRNRLLPLLKSDFNPEVEDALNRLSAILRQEEDYLEQQTKQTFNHCIISRTDHQIIFSRPGLKALHPALLNRVLRAGIKRLKTDLNRISHLHLTTIVDFCFHRSEGKSLDLPGRIRIYKTGKTIKIKKENRPLREIGKQAKEKSKPDDSQQNKKT